MFKNYILIIITLLMVIIPLSASANNTLQLRPAITNYTITVELYIINQDTLSGMQIPLDLGLSKLGLQLDSVSFAG
jgi:hypothetical protein